MFQTHTVQVLGMRQRASCGPQPPPDHLGNALFFLTHLSGSQVVLVTILSSMRTLLSFPFDGWANRGRERLNNLLKEKLDRTSNQILLNPFADPPPRGFREVVLSIDF